MRPTHATAVAALAALAACSAPQFSAQAAYAQLSLDGNVGYVDGTGSVAVSQDIESAFGLGDEQGSPYLRAKADFGSPVLSVSGFTFEEEGQGTLTADFGSILTAGTNVLTDFSLDNAKVALAFDIGIGPVTISPGLAVDYFDLSMTVRDEIGIASEQLEVTGPLPLAFLRGEVELGVFAGMLEIGYVKGDVEDVSAEVLDIEAMLEVRPWEMVTFFVGYRMLDLQGDGQIDGDNVDIDVGIGGFMLGGGLRF